MSPSYDHTRPARVLVTRAAEDAPVLAHAIGRAGFEPVVVPLLERRWCVDDVTRTAEEHPDADWVLVTSATAARVVATAAPSAWRDARWAAVGPSSADRLQQLGYAVHLVPRRATAADLVDAMGDDLQGEIVIYPRADLAASTTADDLRARGATVVDVVAYTNEAPVGHGPRLRAALPVACTTLLSGSAARRIAAVLEPDEREQLGHVVAIGPSTARAADRHGLPVAAVADPHSIQGVVTAVRHLLAQPR